LTISDTLFLKYQTRRFDRSLSSPFQVYLRTKDLKLYNGQVSIISCARKPLFTHFSRAKERLLDKIKLVIKGRLHTLLSIKTVT